jgi:Methylase involved in ubiquinone/menaquinone biosynthesis
MGHAMVLAFCGIEIALAQADMNRLLATVSRRFRRMKRRRKVGRAYDMALEISRIVPAGSTVLDVGCGNGFIAHHLSGILNSTVVGLDVGRSSTSHINYLTYDGRHFPVADRTFDAVLLCYVLHHAQDARLVLDEVRRVLRDGGVTIVYEDNPSGLFDRAVCWTHNVQWKSRTGPCTFQLEAEWRKLFYLTGFTIIAQRELSRWRNISDPVARNFFLLQADPSAIETTLPLRPELSSNPSERELELVS